MNAKFFNAVAKLPGELIAREFSTTNNASFYRDQNTPTEVVKTSAVESWGVYEEYGNSRRSLVAYLGHRFFWLQVKDQPAAGPAIMKAVSVIPRYKPRGSQIKFFGKAE